MSQSHNEKRLQLYKADIEVWFGMLVVCCYRL